MQGQNLLCMFTFYINLCLNELRSNSILRSPAGEFSTGKMNNLRAVYMAPSIVRINEVCLDFDDYRYALQKFW